MSRHELHRIIVAILDGEDVPFEHMVHTWPEMYKMLKGYAQLRMALKQSLEAIL